ncbi:hypothetical protein [Mycolicibacterium moriokaense]|uniref:hypothetical protein n=1 Tax=Mycolicibacterium moriokaense TaxID=39691 RepID=UPI000D769EB5|nr:hypothetical protein [Mycolicibacterium moriokaense]
MDWFRNLVDLSAGAWTALAAWLAVAAGVAALVYAWRQYQRAKEQTAELMQPNVAMFMEPSASDWHLVELVVKNFGRTPAYGIRLDFANPPTVGKYESAYDDRYVDIAQLNLPAEIPYLAPTQEWRIVWDSALDRKELGESIASRFHGEVTYYDEPKNNQKGKRARRQLKSSAVLDWGTLHPVERMELLTTHDLARQEKQKLELLRNLLTYYHYATSESREEVLRVEINRVRAAADELRERYRAEYNHQPADNPVDNPVNAPALTPVLAPVNDVVHDLAFDEAHTTIINGRHRHRLG